MSPRLALAALLFTAMTACSKPAQHPHGGDHDDEHAHGNGQAHRHGHGHGPEDDHDHAAEKGHDHRHGAPHRFENADEWARRFEGPERDAWQKPEAVLAWVGLGASQSLVDIGAGTGYFAVRFARQSAQARVVGVDIEPDMIRYMNERARRENLSNLSAQLGGTDDPKIASPVDVVFVCDTYHHIERRSDYFKKVAASLKPGGKLIIVDFKTSDTPVGPPLQMRVAPETIDAELAPAGFKRVRFDDRTLPHQYMLAYER